MCHGVRVIIIGIQRLVLIHTTVMHCNVGLLHALTKPSKCVHWPVQTTPQANWAIQSKNFGSEFMETANEKWFFYKTFPIFTTQASCIANFVWYRRCWIDSLGVSSNLIDCLDHVLLLHLERCQVDRQSCLFYSFVPILFVNHSIDTWNYLTWCHWRN